MCRIRTTGSILLLCMLLLPAMGAAEQLQSPAPFPPNQPSMAQPPSALPDPAAVPPEQSPLPPQQTPAPTPPIVRSPGRPDGAGATIYPDPSPSSSWSSQSLPTAPPPQTVPPLAYSASRSEAALRVEDLMRGAAAVREQGNFRSAIELYNEALTIAPLYPEAYRQRALTLVRLGDRVQAQVDYNRYLALDPRTPRQVREEMVLFQQSGHAQLGQAEAASYDYGPTVTGQSSESPASNPKLRQFADTRFSLAQDVFQRGDYDSALVWAKNSYDAIPQARTRALMAQILFAQGDYTSAAAEARAAVAMEPTMDWRTLFNDYNYATPRFSQQLHALEDFVRYNPSSADAHFVLGYQRLILGQTQAAHAQLAIASVIEPTDVAATALLAKDGVEVVGSYRPLAQGVSPSAGAEVDRSPMPPSAGVEVARRPTSPPIGVGPWSSFPSDSTRSQPTARSEVLR
jgi:tetratricopeptide (TPR) repeat protein